MDAATEKEFQKKLKELPLVARYFECIFSLEDMYLYRGVIKTYLGKYEGAIKDFLLYRDCVEDSIQYNRDQQLQSETIS